MQRTILASLFLATAAALAGCGGGGDAAVDEPDTAQQHVPAPPPLNCAPPRPPVCL